MGRSGWSGYKIVNRWTIARNKFPIFRLISVSIAVHLAPGMSVQIEAIAEEHDRNDPVTFHRIMQSMIGDRLKARYQAPKRLSHELFVLMLQIKDRERPVKKTEAKRAKPSKATPRRRATTSL